ncbi:uncharacterized protein TNCV_1454971 [Trichonephila clavipes]|nr:uncharacterized protein TNCV_1454971 [Trichonephila clavipes]
MACVLSVRLSKYLTQAFALDDIPKYFGLIPPKLYLGFGAMVPGKILWAIALKKFVLSLEQINGQGHTNPVDLPSRGCFPLQFSESDWWNGPDCIKDRGDRCPKIRN